MEWIYVLTVLASSLAAILAWLAKLRWAREFKEAKDAQIELLKNEIQNLRELAPPKLREYFVSVKQQLEEYNDKLQQEIKQNAQQISELEKSGTEHITEIEQLTHEKQVLEEKVINLRDVITDEVVNHLTQHLFTEFLLRLTKGYGRTSEFIFGTGYEDRRS